MLVPGGNERAFQAAATPRSRRERTLVPGGNDASFQAGTNARSGRQRRLVPGKNERSFQAATTHRWRAPDEASHAWGAGFWWKGPKKKIIQSSFQALPPSAGRLTLKAAPSTCKRAYVPKIAARAVKVNFGSCRPNFQSCLSQLAFTF